MDVDDCVDFDALVVFVEDDDGVQFPPKFMINGTILILI